MQKTIISIIRHKITVIALILILALIPLSLLFSPIKIQTDIFSLLPSEEKNPLKEEAFKLVSQQAAQKIILLFGNDNKNEAYKAATDFYQQNKNADFMKDNDFYLGDDYRKDINSGYFAYRYHLLSDENKKLLQENKGSQIQEKALRILYSPMAMGLSTSPKDDPFMLFNDFFMNLPISKSSLFPYNDVLMAEYEGKHYAFMTVSVPNGSTFSITELQQTMEQINGAIEKTKSLYTGTDVIMSGIPVHSYYSSTNSKNELSTIGNISLIFTILLVYFAFKSVRELSLSMLSMGIGCAIAFTITIWIFGEVHLITLIFGTSLIGVAIDYSFPFFCEYLDGDYKKSGNDVAKKICPELTMGLLTSLMGYAALAITPFPGLQQMACFSMIGLFVAYLTVVIIYPAIYKPIPLRKKSFLLWYAEKFFKIFNKIMSLRATFYIFIILLIMTVFGLYKLTPNDDIRLLYTPQKNLLENEILTRKIMGQYKASQFFLVTADSEQSVLLKEESLRKGLDKLIGTKSISSYNAISQLVPSINEQKENYNLIKNSLINPYSARHAKTLGIDKTDLKNNQEFFNKQSDRFLTLDEAFRHSTFKILKPLWLGQIDGAYASVILLNNVTSTDALKNLNQENNGIYFMDKVDDISNIMAKYRHIAIKMLIIAYLVIFIVLYFRYGITRAFLVFFPPALSGLLTLAIIGYAGYSINLFNILGLFLILGFAIDYTVFYAEGENRKLTTSIAIFLSFLTNILSFGLLALSSLPLIHSFGLVMLLGMIFSYLLAPIVTLSSNKNKETTF